MVICILVLYQKYIMPGGDHYIADKDKSHLEFV